MVLDPHADDDREVAVGPVELHVVIELDGVGHDDEVAEFYGFAEDAIDGALVASSER